MNNVTQRREERKVRIISELASMTVLNSLISVKLLSNNGTQLLKNGIL